MRPNNENIFHFRNNLIAFLFHLDNKRDVFFTASRITYLSLTRAVTVDARYMKLLIDNITCMSDSRRGFGLEIGFTQQTQVVTTNHYNIIANFHILQITIAQAVFSFCRLH
jgi:hypothetical protein